MAENWDDEADSPEAQASRIVAGLVRLADDDEACRLLGVDGTLEDEIDVTFLSDPLSWIANEVASGIRGANEEDEGVSLSTIVALLRLYRTLRGGVLDEGELRDAVIEFLGEDEDDE
ncbi:MAG: hypothetical protein ACRDI2_20295 [Chloroflexota bacterium]